MIPDPPTPPKLDRDLFLIIAGIAFITQLLRQTSEKTMQPWRIIISLSGLASITSVVTWSLLSSWFTLPSLVAVGLAGFTGFFGVIVMSGLAVVVEKRYGIKILPISTTSVLPAATTPEEEVA